MSTPAAPSGPPSFAWHLVRIVGLLGLALLLPGCDNPACVFGGDCSNAGGGGPGGVVLPATFPDDGQWLAPGAPRVTAAFPTGAGASTTSPVVLVFSESIAADTLEGGFVLVRDLPSDAPPGTPNLPPTPLSGALVGEGRVAVLSPLNLEPGISYRVRASDQGSVRDLSGDLLDEPSSADLATFTVAETNPAAPRLLTTWPPAGTATAGTVTSIVAIFDRAMNPSTVTSTSFRVLVDGLPPAVDPPPQVLTVPGPFGGDVPEARVFTWRSVDAAGVLQSLGVDLPVELQLSPAGGTDIEAGGGGTLAPVGVTFRTAVIELPLGAEILSSSPEVPDDAIGRAQLDGAAPLMVLVRLAQPALAGDVLRFGLFGTDFGTPPRTVALARSVELAAGQDEVLLEPVDIGLTSSTAPLTARFDDGAVAFAFQVVRGTTASQVRLLDTDPDTAGIQDPLLDLAPPSLVGLGFDGTLLDLRSELPDLVLTGLADEAVRAVRVEALLLGGTQDNGAVPRAVAANEDGGFVAAPIPLGLIDPAEGAIPVLVTVFDRALNPSLAFAGTYTQVGAVGPGLAAPGGDVEVRVFSGATLAPIAGARVFVHEDDAGVLAPIDTALTGSDGVALLATAPVGTTLVTVEAAGHDLFTFQGLATARIDVPLAPTTPSPALVGVALSSPVQDLAQLSLRASDSRRAPELGPTVESQGCFFNPFTQTTDCGFLPFPIAAGASGALSVFAVNPSAGNSPAFALVFLKAFQLVVPLGPVDAADTQTLTLQIPALLDAIGADPEEAAVDVAPHVLFAGASVPGLDTGALSGLPRVSVQALAVGIPGPVFVGLGRTFQVTPESWAVRAAFAGVADGVQDDPDDALGALVAEGTIDGDLFLAAELVDAAGNRALARPRLSTTSFVLDPPGVPTVQGGTVEGGTGSLAFTVTVTDGLVDADGQPGLHRVRIVDVTGRGWDLWAVDRPDAAGGSLLATFPDVTALGGTGLAAAGSYVARAATYAWPDLDTGSALGGFLWSAVGRLHELHSASAPLVF